MFQLIGRFMTRPDDNLIIGKVVTKNEIIKPGYVYDLYEMMGELVVKEVGKTAMKDNITESKKYRSEFTWGMDVNSILTSGSSTFMTENESLTIHKKRKNDEDCSSI